jgi:hypothetical protein
MAKCKIAKLPNLVSLLEKLHDATTRKLNRRNDPFTATKAALVIEIETCSKPTEASATS